MKKFKKITLAIFSVLILAILGFASYLKFALPDVGPAPEVKIEATPARLERGKYLSEHVAACIDCHSSRDWTRYAGPVIRGTEGRGGEVFGKELGFPGTFYSTNITPAQLGSWSDGEILRAITCGVSKDGHALFPVMPYHEIGKMTMEDVYSIIAYIRTLKPIQSDVPASRADFPVSLLMNLEPGKAPYANEPDAGNAVEQGRYLVNAAGCMFCHSKDDKGKIIAGTEFGGGRVFRMPGYTLTTANITPDQETGIGNWTRDAFVKRFKDYADTGYHSPVLGKGDVNTLMPWTLYAGMKTEDLQAIYEYLRTVKPVSNAVIKFVKK